METDSKFGLFGWYWNLVAHRDSRTTGQELMSSVLTLGKIYPFFLNHIEMWTPVFLPFHYFLWERTRNNCLTKLNLVHKQFGVFLKKFFFKCSLFKILWGSLQTNWNNVDIFEEIFCLILSQSREVNRVNTIIYISL